MDVFVSHSDRDRAFVQGKLVKLLRERHVQCVYFKDFEAGRGLQDQISEGLHASSTLLVVVSQACIERPDEVRKEIDAFLALKGRDARVVPIVLEGASPGRLHERLDAPNGPVYIRVKEDEGLRWRADLLHALGMPAPDRDQFAIGSVTLPYFVLVGGDGAHRYRHPDGVVCAWDDSAPHVLPDELRVLQDRRVAELRAKGAVVEDKEMVRLLDYSWGLDGPGESEWPLRLVVGRTSYVKQLGTNAAMKDKLPDGRTVAEAYAGPADVFRGSVLANALATNLSVVTADRMIFVATRGQKVAINPGGYSSAVSGTASPLLDTVDGAFSPFATAIREAREEVFSPLSPRPEEVTFFGLARTSLNRFPLLFGEVRTPLTSAELASRARGWENGRLIGIPFTIEAVAEWVKPVYVERVAGRGHAADNAAMFSLIQSLLHEYPDRWDEVAAALTFDVRG